MCTKVSPHGMEWRKLQFETPVIRLLELISRGGGAKGVVRGMAGLQLPTARR